MVSTRTCLLAALAALAAACGAPESAETSRAAPAAETTMQQERILLAESAAPPAIASQATIVDFVDGEARQLREGTNGWLCLPDEPATPMVDPLCLDAAWQHWLEAYEARTAPRITGVGISYMLKGGAAASNDDPFATEPPAGEAWLEDGPHLMLIVPDPARQLQGLPTDPHNGGPYVMWAGSEYAHVMIPVGPMR